MKHKITLFILFLFFLLGLFHTKVKAVTSIGGVCLPPICLPAINLPEIPCFTCPTKCPTPTPGSPSPTPSGPGEPTVTLPPPSSEGGDGGGGSQGGGPPGPPHCDNQTPPAPYLRTLTKIKFGEVELIWDPVEQATHYTISYGPSSSNYLYGVPNTGKVSSFKIGDLGSGNYCFVVRAVNDCAPSDPSNELCTGGQVLGASVLGATGGFSLQLWQGLVIMAVICGISGVKKYFFGQKRD